MKYQLKNELPLLVLVALPFLYLLLIWNTLPDTVPIHWNYNGEIDGTGRKESLFLIPFFLPVLTYVTFLLIPILDKRNKLEQMGGKFIQFRSAMVFITAVLALFILHSSKEADLGQNLMMIIMGTLFVICGNFFPVIKPNLYIGIRLPWTMNDDENWKQTHRFAGKIWVVGGIVIIFSGLLLEEAQHTLLSLSITAALVLIPTIFSYRLHRQALSK